MHRHRAYSSTFCFMVYLGVKILQGSENITGQ